MYVHVRPANIKSTLGTFACVYHLTMHTMIHYAPLLAHMKEAISGQCCSRKRYFPNDYIDAL
jgi:hypothetical protein